MNNMQATALLSRSKQQPIKQPLQIGAYKCTMFSQCPPMLPPYSGLPKIAACVFLSHNDATLLAHLQVD